MIIGIDAREIQAGVRTGIGRALAVFLDYFQRIDDKNRIVLFSSAPLPLVTNDRVTSVVKSESNTFLWDQGTLTQLIRKHHVDVFYSPYYKIPLLCPCPVVSAIFDLIYIYVNSYRREMSLGARLYFRTMGTFMAHRATTIFTCSEYSKRDVVRYHRVRPDKVKVIYLGLDKAYHRTTDPRRIERAKATHGIPGRYVLYTGNFKPHKNVETLITAFDAMRDEFPDTSLVLAGPRDRHHDRILPLIKGKRVIVTGTVPLEEQVALYSGADLFAIASLSEGFGFSPLEAMACGAPVISSNAGSLPEVVGDAGILVDPLSHGHLAQKMKEVLQSSSLRETMSEAGMRRAALFSQERYAQALNDLLTSRARGIAT